MADDLAVESENPRNGSSSGLHSGCSPSYPHACTECRGGHCCGTNAGAVGGEKTKSAALHNMESLDLRPHARRLLEAKYDHDLDCTE